MDQMKDCTFKPDISATAYHQAPVSAEEEMMGMSQYEMRLGQSQENLSLNY